MGDLSDWSVRSAPEGALSAPQCVYNVLLPTAGSARTFTVSGTQPQTGDSFPEGAKYVVFSLQNNEDVFYARWDGEAAAVPAADKLDGGGSEINPEMRWIGGIEKFSIVSPYAGTIVTMAFYKDDTEAGRKS